jgi:hypothetical protein
MNVLLFVLAAFSELPDACDGLEMAIVHDNPTSSQVYFVTNTCKVPSVLGKYVLESGFELVRSTRPGLFELVDGVSPLVELIRLAVELVLVVSAKRVKRNLLSFNRTFHSGGLAGGTMT